MTANKADNNSHDSGEASDAKLIEGTLSLETILRLLAHHQRRDLLSYLIDTPDQTSSLEECVEYLLTREAERTGERPQRGQVEGSIHHSHIPKLRDVDVLEYDPRSREIRYWGHDHLETWLDRIQDHEPDPQ